MVLRTFGDILKKATRVSDMRGRFAGDLFLLAISHVQAENIEIAINRIRELRAERVCGLAAQSG